MRRLHSTYYIAIAVFMTFVTLAVFYDAAHAIGVDVRDLDQATREFHDHALEQTRTLVGGSAEGFILRGLKVTSLRHSEEADTGCRPGIRACDLQAKVIGYTILGIPYTTFDVTCCEVRRRLLW